MARATGGAGASIFRPRPCVPAHAALAAPGGLGCRTSPCGTPCRTPLERGPAARGPGERRMPWRWRRPSGHRPARQDRAAAHGRRTVGRGSAWIHSAHEGSRPPHAPAAWGPPVAPAREAACGGQQAQRHSAGLSREGRALRRLHSRVFTDGGLFVPTTREYKLGEDIYLLLSLPDDPQRFPRGRQGGLDHAGRTPLAAAPRAWVCVSPTTTSRAS